MTSLLDLHRTWAALALLAATGLAGAVAACSSSNDTSNGTSTDGGVDATADARHDAHTPSFEAGFDVTLPDIDANQPPDTGPNVDAPPPFDAGIDSPPPFDAGIDSPPPPIDAGLDAPLTPDCSAPPTLHVEDGGPGTLFCPFGPDAGAPVWCDPGVTLCCIYGMDDAGVFPPSECASGACTNGPAPAAIACEDQNDCPGGDVCCANALVAQDVACGYYFGHGLTATTCRPTACIAGEVVICSSDSECTAPQTCVPFKEKGIQWGFCQ
jgi:hypothetical protein